MSFLKDSNSLTRKDAEKLAESGSSAEESDGEEEANDGEQVIRKMLLIIYISRYFDYTINSIYEVV